jgi:hypothetical protein
VPLCLLRLDRLTLPKRAKVPSLCFIRLIIACLGHSSKRERGRMYCVLLLYHWHAGAP